MPPKYKFTKNQIIEASVSIVRENGINALSARTIAKKLGSSSKVIFGLFANMDDLRNEVISYANILYQSYIDEGMKNKKYPPYKASGIAYIQFAKNEKELFKLLFMRDRTGEKIEENRDDVKPFIKMIVDKIGISEETAFLVHLELWIYVHGIATMAATSYLDWDIEFISQTLSDIFEGLKTKFKGENNDKRDKNN